MSENNKAGQRRQYRHWTKKNLTEAIRDWRKLHGYTPRARDFADADPDEGWPYPSEYVRNFGSWAAGVKAAGLKPRARGGQQKRVGIDDRERTATCPNCGKSITAYNPNGPMMRHIKRCPANISELAALVGADDSNPQACWVPTVTKGRAKVRGKRAHIVAFELVYGPVPFGMVVMHTCDTGNCVNPQHFRAGTQADNIRDMMIKGRHRGATDA